MSKKCPNTYWDHCMCVCIHEKIKKGLQAAEQCSCLCERLLPLNKSAVCLSRWAHVLSADVHSTAHWGNAVTLLCFNPLYLCSFFFSSLNPDSLQWLAQYFAGSQNRTGLVYYLSISSETGNLHDLSAYLCLCRLVRVKVHISFCFRQTHF